MGDSRDLLLIIEVMMNFSLGFENKQTVKCTSITLYNCTVHFTIRTRAQSIKRQQMRRTSQESEMVTLKHVTEVVRNRCVIHQAKRVDSRAELLLIATSVWALIIWTIKQTKTNSANQTNKQKKKKKKKKKKKYLR